MESLMTEYAKTGIWQSHEIGLKPPPGVKWEYLSKILGYILLLSVVIIPIDPIKSFLLNSPY